VRLIRSVIKFCRGGKPPYNTNDVRIAQLDNCTSPKGMISQAHNMTVNCFHGGKQYTELYRRCTGEISLTICLFHSHGVITPSMPNIPYLHSLPYPLCAYVYITNHHRITMTGVNVKEHHMGEVTWPFD
jgi:hypothetical protein